MPCLDWFEAQDQAYRDSVLPPAVRARVSVEAGIAHAVVAVARRRRRDRLDRALRRLRRLQDPVPRVRLHHRARRHRRPHQPRPRLPRDRVTDRPTRPHQREEPLMAPNERLAALSAAGVSIWLDDLSRERLQPATSQELIADKHVVGVTTNPTIFQAALANGAGLRRAGPRAGRPRRRRSTTPSARSPPTTSATPATCSPAPASHRRRRRPGLASRSTRGSPTTPTPPSRRPLDLWKIVDRPNLLIKIPATQAGLPAITARARRGHQRQRHADLLRRALPRR